jgi:hypothetical protein
MIVFDSVVKLFDSSDNNMWGPFCRNQTDMSPPHLTISNPPHHHAEPIIIKHSLKSNKQEQQRRALRSEKSVRETGPPVSLIPFNLPAAATTELDDPVLLPPAVVVVVEVAGVDFLLVLEPATRIKTLSYTRTLYFIFFLSMTYHAY